MCGTNQRICNSDKHFAWSDTVEILAELCPSSAIAIISRWRDRRFGNHRSILAWTIEHLVKKNKINALDALPLITFENGWHKCGLLDSVLSSCTDEKDKSMAFEVVYQYTKFDLPNIQHLKNLDTIATSLGIEHSELKERISGLQHTEAVSKKSSLSSDDNEQGHEKEWSSFLRIVTYRLLMVLVQHTKNFVAFLNSIPKKPSSRKQ